MEPGFPRRRCYHPSGEKPFFAVDYGWEAAVERDSQRPRRPISQDQLDVYIEWRGGEELYARSGRRDARMFDQAWKTLSELQQKMHSVALELGSARYRAAVEAELEALVPDAKVREALWTLAREGFPDRAPPPREGNFIRRFLKALRQV